MVISQHHIQEMHRLAKRKNVKGLNKLSCITKSPYTMVSVNLKDKRGVGFAKCSPKDLWKEDIGFSIALSRAIDDACSSA